MSRLHRSCLSCDACGLGFDAGSDVELWPSRAAGTLARFGVRNRPSAPTAAENALVVDSRDVLPCAIDAD